MPFGATLLSGGGARFALWAPASRRVEVVLERSGRERRASLVPDPDRWFQTVVDDALPGDLYRFAVDDRDPVPDPAARFQPRGALGPSELVDASAFDWPDDDWRGRPFEEAVFYELHVGTFTPKGSYTGVVERLHHLARLGVTALELMPVSDCPGDRNWGYDGVLPFAPAARYGRPEELKTLIAAAHEHGLMVFLDVVYNHFGPQGNFLRQYAPGFFTTEHATPWGDAIDFESPESTPVREYFIHNALYWLTEYHLDGLRLDAVHAIHDSSEPDFLEELADRVRERVGDRPVHLVLENDDNHSRRLARDARGRPLQYTAQWNDDLHHAMHVMLTGESEGYYVDYADSPARHLGRCLASGFAYQGEASAHRGNASRGEPTTGLPATAFVGFLQNHDQVGNRAFGERLRRLAPAQAVEAATLVLLLSPSPPLLFMGEEWGAEEPFLYFCGFEGELAQAVTEGRRREFGHFRAFRDPASREHIPDPCDPGTFESAVLSWEDVDREPHRSILARHRELLTVRRREICPRLAGAATGGHFEVSAGSSLRVEWELADSARLVLMANLSEAPVASGWAAPRGRLLAAVPADLADSIADGRMPAWAAGSWLAQE